MKEGKGRSNIMQKFFVLFRTQCNYTFNSTPELSHNKDTFLDIFRVCPSCFLWSVLFPMVPTSCKESQNISVFFRFEPRFLLNRQSGPRSRTRLIIIKRTQLRTSVLSEKPPALQREHWALQSTGLTESGSVFVGPVEIPSGYLSIERYQAFLVVLIS